MQVKCLCAPWSPKQGACQGLRRLPQASHAPRQRRGSAVLHREHAVHQPVHEQRCVAAASTFECIRETIIHHALQLCWQDLQQGVVSMSSHGQPANHLSDHRPGCTHPHRCQHTCKKLLLHAASPSGGSLACNTGRQRRHDTRSSAAAVGGARLQPFNALHAARLPNLHCTATCGHRRCGAWLLGVCQRAAGVSECALNRRRTQTSATAGCGAVSDHVVHCTQHHAAAVTRLCR
jgi:hypothetical protein